MNGRPCQCGHLPREHAARTNATGRHSPHECLADGCRCWQYVPILIPPDEEDDTL